MNSLKSIYILFLFISLGKYSNPDIFKNSTDVIPYVKDKCQSVSLDRFSAEVLHVQTKQPLNDSEIDQWVLQTMQKMNIGKEHPRYEEMYHNLFEQHQYQTANMLRKLKINKTKYFYVLSQRPLTLEEIEKKEHIFNDEKPYYSTLINDYTANTSYLIDPMYKTILRSEGNTWGEENELLNMFVPERELTAFIVLTDPRNPEKWSLQPIKNATESDCFDFSYIQKNGANGKQRISFYQSDRDIQLKKIEYFLNNKKSKSVEWSEFVYDETLQISLAKKYKSIQYDNDKIISQKEYRLYSYQLGDPVEEIKDVSDLLKIYKGYQLQRNKESSSEVETIGVVGESVYKEP